MACCNIIKANAFLTTFELILGTILIVIIFLSPFWPLLNDIILSEKNYEYDDSKLKYLEYVAFGLLILFWIGELYLTLRKNPVGILVTCVFRIILSVQIIFKILYSSALSWTPSSFNLLIFLVWFLINIAKILLDTKIWESLREENNEDYLYESKLLIQLEFGLIIIIFGLVIYSIIISHDAKPTPESVQFYIDIVFKREGLLNVASLCISLCVLVIELVTSKNTNTFRFMRISYIIGYAIYKGAQSYNSTVLDSKLNIDIIFR